MASLSGHKAWQSNLVGGDLEYYDHYRGRRDCVASAVFCFAAAGGAEERGTAGAQPRGVRLRVRADGRGEGFRGGCREGAEGAPRARGAARRTSLRRE